VGGISHLTKLFCKVELDPTKIQRED